MRRVRRIGVVRRRKRFQGTPDGEQDNGPEIDVQGDAASTTVNPTSTFGDQ
jgi:hypothetical protein